MAGYRIVWRETNSQRWEGALYVGNTTQYTVNQPKDNFLFCVQVIAKDSNVSVATYPLPQR